MQTQETTRKTSLRLLAAAVPLALLAACGGGGGGGDTATPTTTTPTTTTSTATGTGSGTTTGTTLSTTVSAATTQALTSLQTLLNGCLAVGTRITAVNAAGDTYAAACQAIYDKTSATYLHSGLSSQYGVVATFANTTVFPAGSTVLAPSQVLESTVNGVTYAFADFAVRLPSGVTKEVPLVVNNGGASSGWQFYGDQRPYELKMRANAVRQANLTDAGVTYVSNLEVNLGGGSVDNRIQTIAITKKGDAAPFVYAHNLAGAGATSPAFCFSTSATAPAACPTDGTGGNWRSVSTAVSAGQLYTFQVTERTGLTAPVSRAVTSYEIPLMGSLVTSQTELAALPWARLTTTSLADANTAATNALATPLALAWGALTSGYVDNAAVDERRTAGATTTTTAVGVTFNSATTATAALTAGARTGLNVTLTSKTANGTSLHTEYQ